MKKTDYYRYVANHINNYIEDVENISISPVEKNNGVTYDALFVKRVGVSVSPIIYLEPFYQELINGNVTAEESLQKLADTYNMHSNYSFDDLAEDFLNFERIQERITMSTVNYYKNIEMLEQVPHMKKEDLAIVYRYVIDLGNQERGSILIKNDHMKMWGISSDELHQIAIENSNRMFPATVRSLSEIVNQTLGLDALGDLDHEMYIISNNADLDGAAAMFYSNALSDLADQLDRDIVVLPSSTHEVIALAYEPGMDMSSMSAMVREVNRTQLDAMEILSDHVYIYQAKEMELKIADTTLEDIELKEKLQRERQKEQEMHQEKAVILNFPKL